MVVAIAGRVAGIPAVFLRVARRSGHLLCDLYAGSRTTTNIELIRRNNVPGAAIALGLSMLGFALPVASAVAHAADIVDCIIWSIIALLVQIIAYYVARIPVPDLSEAD